MLAALREPARFTRLILVDSPSAMSEERAKPLVDGSRRDYPATVAAFVDACTPEPDVEHIRRWGREILLRAEPEAAARLLECLYEAPLELDPARIAQPTLLIHGADDAIIPIAAAHELERLIPDVRLEVFEATGHVPTLTRPARVAAAIANFLGS